MIIVRIDRKDVDFLYLMETIEVFLYSHVLNN